MIPRRERPAPGRPPVAAGCLTGSQQTGGRQPGQRAEDLRFGQRVAGQAVCPVHPARHLAGCEDPFEPDACRRRGYPDAAQGVVGTRRDLVHVVLEIDADVAQVNGVPVALEGFPGRASIENHAPGVSPAPGCDLPCDGPRQNVTRCLANGPCLPALEQLLRRPG